MLMITPSSVLHFFSYPASRDLSYRHEELVLRGDMRDLCSQGIFFLGLNDNDWRSSLLRLQNRSKEYGRFAPACPAVPCELTLRNCSTEDVGHVVDSR